MWADCVHRDPPHSLERDRADMCSDRAVSQTDGRILPWEMVGDGHAVVTDRCTGPLTHTTLIPPLVSLHQYPLVLVDSMAVPSGYCIHCPGGGDTRVSTKRYNCQYELEPQAG